MDQRKKNSSLWYFAGLALLMLLAVLVISAGPAFARYKSGTDKYLQFAVREPEQICFGTMNEGEFAPSEDSFEWDPTEEGTATLEFTVANGSSGTRYSQKDQKVFIRLTGSLGLKNGDEIAKITLKDETGKEIEATAVPISEGTEYFNSVGNGWIFSFFENEEEYYWILEGGKLSTVTITITIDISAIEGAIMLAPEAVAEIIK